MNNLTEFAYKQSYLDVSNLKILRISKPNFIVVDNIGNKISKNKSNLFIKYLYDCV